MKRIFRLVHNQAKQGAIDCIKSPEYDGYVVTIEEPLRNILQNNKLHGVIADISKQSTFQGEMISSEDWKRLLIDGFCRVRQAEGNPLSNHGRVVPSLDGSGIVQLGMQSRKFKKADASEFIEYLIAWGVDQGVKFTDHEQSN